MTLFRSPIIVLDTETTGFPRQPWARVIELAAVLIDCDGNESDTWESLILPDILDDRANGALAINQITREMLIGQPSAFSAAASFRGWMGDAPPYVTSFNVAFDRPMCERTGLTSLRWASCVMERSMAVMGPAGVLGNANPRHPNYDPGRPWLWPKLSAAAEWFGVPVVGEAHRALTDARTAAGIMIAIQRKTHVDS